MLAKMFVERILCMQVSFNMLTSLVSYVQTGNYTLQNSVITVAKQILTFNYFKRM